MADVQELKQRYMQICNCDGIDGTILNKIEETLKLKLPEDFRGIASFYSGGLLGGISVFAVAYENINPNIVDETIRLRKAIKLPMHYVVLAEPPESLIVMDVENTPSIIWCDATDAVRLNDKSFIKPPQTWSNYMEFFTTLVEDEEEEQL